MLEKLPEEFRLADVVLCNFRNFTNREILVEKLVWYRNMFRHNFLNTNRVTTESTEKYIHDVVNNTKMRVMYAVTLENTLIGVYGMKEFSGNRFLLDNAMRFSRKGGKSLFSDIGKCLISSLYEIEGHSLVFTAIKNGNKLATGLHSYGTFRVMEGKEVDGLDFGSGIELKKFVEFS